MKEQLDGKIYFAVKHIQVIAEGELINSFYNWSTTCFV